MKKLRKLLPLCAVAGMAAFTAPATQAQAQVGVGLNLLINVQACLGSPLRVLALTSDQRLICFAEGLPQFVFSVNYITGFVGDTKLIGIDYRRADGKLYGVGNAGGVYAITPANAAAAKVSQLTVLPVGNAFGVDFNPINGALRIVTDSGQNLRHSLVTNLTIADAPLSYGAGTATGISSAAYSNNDASPDTGTTLFVIDANLDQVAIQSPPNSGQLVATGKLNTGASSQVGFDIFSQEADGVTTNFQRAYASFPNDGASVFYQIDLLIGAAYPVGKFPAGVNVIDIAVPLERNLLPGVALRLPLLPVN